MRTLAFVAVCWAVCLATGSVLYHDPAVGVVLGTAWHVLTFVSLVDPDGVVI